MRKNIKTCICVVTTILPIVLSACSNKADDTNTLKTEKNNTTTFVNDTSSDITDTTEKITTVETTEEDTTELISVTEQDTSEDVTKQQQTTIITSVNSTPVPVQTTPRLTETTPPRPTETDQTTTPVMITPEYPEYPEYPNPTLTVKGVNKGEKYSYNDVEFTINSVEYSFHSIDYDGYCAIEFDINISSKEFISPYCIYNIYNSNDDCIETGTITFSHSHIENDYKVSNGHFLHTNRIPSDDFTIVIEFPSSQLN